MKKHLLLLFFLSLFTSSYSQIWVTDKKSTFKKFKETETIFLLSNVYDSDTYTEILKESWTVTPFKVIEIEEFNPSQYVGGKYSFVTLHGHRTTTQQGNVYTTAYMQFFVFDEKDKKKELEKFAKKSDKDKQGYDLMNEYRLPISSIIFHYSDKFSEGMRTSPARGYEVLYQEDAFVNYKSGFLKNNFKSINNFIEQEKEWPTCETASTPDLKALKKQPLFIPQYIVDEYKAIALQDTEDKAQGIKDLFKEYKYKYEIMDDEELNKKILSGEEFYYARFTLSGPKKYLHIINSKTGEMAFANCYFGKGAHLKPNNLEDVMTAILKGKF